MEEDEHHEQIYQPKMDILHHNLDYKKSNQ
jgi:hypothetical protein